MTGARTPVAETHSRRLREEQVMLGVFEHYIPNFNTFNKQRQLDIILNACDKDNGIFILPMFHYSMLSKSLLSKQKDSVHLPKRYPNLIFLVQ